MKTCFKCKKEKPLAEFYKHPRMADGRLNKCKECAKDDVSKNYASNKPHYQAYEKKRLHKLSRIEARAKYAVTERGRQAESKAKKKWADANAIKKGASTIVGNAVRGGVIEKQYFCSVCGIDNVRIHGHHPDYAKPLEVQWLCSPCHIDWHKENGEGKNG